MGQWGCVAEGAGMPGVDRYTWGPATALSHVPLLCEHKRPREEEQAHPSAAIKSSERPRRARTADVEPEAARRRRRRGDRATPPLQSHVAHPSRLLGSYTPPRLLTAFFTGPAALLRASGPGFGGKGPGMGIRGEMEGAALEGAASVTRLSGQGLFAQGSGGFGCDGGLRIVGG